MFHLPYTNPMLILSDFALANAKSDIKELDDAVTMHQDMQDNLCSFLGSMPVLADIIEEWQTSSYFEQDNEGDLLTLYQMLRIVETRMHESINLNDAMDISEFMVQLHQTLSGCEPKREVELSWTHDLYDSSYLPFLESYVKNVLTA